MPFEHRQPRRQSAEHGIGSGGRQEHQIRPIGIEATCVEDLATGGDGQQLGAEAHSQDGEFVIERGLQQRHLGGQEPILLDPGRALAPAERDDPGDLAGRGQRVAGGGVSLDHGATRGTQRLANEADLTVGQVRDDQHGPHARQL